MKKNFADFSWDLMCDYLTRGSHDKELAEAFSTELTDVFCAHVENNTPLLVVGCTYHKSKKQIE